MNVKRDDECGQGIVTYVIVLAVIAAVVLGVFRLFGGGIQSKTELATSEMGNQGSVETTQVAGQEASPEDSPSYTSKRKYANYKQDEKGSDWSGEPLGGVKGTTIGDSGCVLVRFAEMLGKDPKTLNDELVAMDAKEPDPAKKCFYANGGLNYDNVARKYGMTHSTTDS